MNSYNLSLGRHILADIFLGTFGKADLGTDYWNNNSCHGMWVNHIQWMDTHLSHACCTSLSMSRVSNYLIKHLLFFAIKPTSVVDCWIAWMFYLYSMFNFLSMTKPNWTKSCDLLWLGPLKIDWLNIISIKMSELGCSNSFLPKLLILHDHAWYM